ncbi:hypothetical protein SBRCBS47491_004657 [Sporothrix bragantina]|uniref:Beta-glucuronidase C-terminal domain-containing protein n=1 Tax=Sporothrix bragantina TaxID=671064 RepID=A0ABP0BQ90_9PEZI
MGSLSTLAVACAVLCQALLSLASVTYAVPKTYNTGGFAYAPVSGAPVGISFEFFAFPKYFNSVPATSQCLANWHSISGTWPPIRIGGTTQDRATYDASSADYVDYTVASSTDAPSALTFGPSFMSLAGGYSGSVVLGLNRGYNNVTNTIAAAQTAVKNMGNLIAIELGNEPEYFASAGQAITSGISWTPAADAASQDNWDIWVGSAVAKKAIIQAGVWLSSPSTWGNAELIATENTTAQQYVGTYCHHNYPGGTIQSLMTHSTIASNVNGYKSDIAAALAVGKPYVFGETNSATGGGASGVSPTYGAALWTMDYSLRAVANNVSRLYFHHGTVGACQYCFWGVYDMGAPYYGATVATAALAGASHIAVLDDGTTNYGGYVTYDASGNALRALLYNSDYFDGTGTRSSQTFTLTGLAATSVKAKRLTAANVLSRVDQGSPPTWGGQTYTNGNCVVSGTETFETTTVTSGAATFTLQASEALLVNLQ